MEKMYIHKIGAQITIGDTITGNTNLGEGHRFLWYSLRDAEKEYRRIYNLKGKKFEHKNVGKDFFYIF